MTGESQPCIIDFCTGIDPAQDLRLRRPHLLEQFVHLIISTRVSSPDRASIVGKEAVPQDGAHAPGEVVVPFDRLGRQKLADKVERQHLQVAREIIRRVRGSDGEFAI